MLAAGTAVRLITGPVISRLADRLGKHQQILTVLLAMAAVIAFGYGLRAAFAIFLLVSVAPRGTAAWSDIRHVAPCLHADAVCDCPAGTGGDSPGDIRHRCRRRDVRHTHTGIRSTLRRARPARVLGHGIALCRCVADRVRNAPDLDQCVRVESAPDGASVGSPATRCAYKAISRRPYEAAEIIRLRRGSKSVACRSHGVTSRAQIQSYALSRPP